jgi:hypothetical protein
MQLSLPTGVVQLGADTFVAAGGEAEVHTVDGWAYKVWDDAARVPTTAKLRELSRLRHPGAVLPDRRVCAPDGTPRAVRMRLLDQHRPLTALYAPAARARLGVTRAHQTALCEQLSGLVRAAHAAGLHLVDLNGMNVLVSDDHATASVIDTDSWQTPTHPATALMPAVRDPHATAFDDGTDWFAFAVVTFQLWTGIHPYRGSHPSLRTLTDRMAADVSVFDPAVVLPPMVDLGELPPAWEGWYRDTFGRGHRGPPPSASPRVLPVVRGSDGLTHTPRLRTSLPIRGVHAQDARVWHWDDAGVYCERQRQGPPPGDVVAVRGPRGPVFVDRTLEVRDHTGSALHTTAMAAEAVVAGRDGVWLLCAGRLLELVVHGHWATARPATQATPHATRLFSGVGVTQVLGATWLHLLSPGEARNVRCHELDGVTVVDAAHHAGLTTVVGLDGDGWHQWVLHGDRLTEEALDGPIAAEVLALPTGLGLVRRHDGLTLHDLREPMRTRRVQAPIPHRLVAVDGTVATWDDCLVSTCSLP